MHLTTLLRRNQTPWERKLWDVLRVKGLGIKFRRQVKIENFIVDFLCPAKKLIIELDGGHHNEKQNKETDLNRQRKLEVKGYKVLRFWNNEVDSNLEGVVEKILGHIKQSSPASPLIPPRERGGR
ncbi:MAG: endonuclease domain-containing protein [bacterium]|nr:endonuclease domain-containing protein [bacterium]